MRRLLISALLLFLIIANYFLSFILCGSGESFADSNILCKCSVFFLNFPAKWIETEIPFIFIALLHIIFYFVFIYVIIDLGIRIVMLIRQYVNG